MKTSCFMLGSVLEYFLVSEKKKLPAEVAHHRNSLCMI